MIALANPATSDWRERFLELMPAIERQASYAFRHLGVEAKMEAMADVVANAWVAFHRLAEKGKASIAYPTVLVRYAVAQFYAGRRVGTPTNTLDVTSPASMKKHGHQVESITPADDDSWKALVVESRVAGPADVAATRIDFGDWLETLPGKRRQMVTQMCEGYSTSELAENHSVSRGRISQIRREMEESWDQFIDDDETLDGEEEFDWFDAYDPEANTVDWDRLDLDRRVGLIGTSSRLTQRAA